jgi:16S rRNA (uracil1498-N3)-methyltransferase
MRALYLPHFAESQEELKIVGDDYHHLAKVLRIKVSDDVLLLNGEGLTGQGKVLGVTKDEIVLRCTGHERETPKTRISLACGMVKKSTAELMYQQAIEMGVKHVYFYASEYAQELKVDERRMQLLGKNALEQSNNPFLTTYSLHHALSDEQFNQYEGCHCFHLKSQTQNNDEIKVDLSKPTLIFIGPEGGFSAKDLTSMPLKTQWCFLPGPILRAETAAVAAVAYLKGKNFTSIE